MKTFVLFLTIVLCGLNVTGANPLETAELPLRPKSLKSGEKNLLAKLGKMLADHPKTGLFQITESCSDRNLAGQKVFSHFKLIYDKNLERQYHLHK